MGFEDDIAKIFKKARVKQNLTQADVAKKAEIHVNYYAMIERGEKQARGRILNSIAKALNIKLQLPI